MPRVPPAQIVPEVKLLSYPYLSMVGMARSPIVATEAPITPVQAAKTVQTTTTAIATPPITVFANARFARYAPFGRGRVILGESQSALPIQVFTTTGFLKPGIFQRGTKVKIIFRKSRMGFSTDYFAVPLEEVPEKQRDKNGVEETALKWKSLEISEPKVTDVYKKQFPKMLQAVSKFVQAIPKSPRAQRDLMNWTRKIQVKTGGGRFGLILDKQRIKVVKEKVARPDLNLVVEDPAHLVGWTKGDSIVNLIRTGAGGIDNLQDMETIFKLDRLHRSIRRDAEERAGK